MATDCIHVPVEDSNEEMSDRLKLRWRRGAKEIDAININANPQLPLDEPNKNCVGPGFTRAKTTRRGLIRSLWRSRQRCPTTRPPRGSQSFLLRGRRANHHTEAIVARKPASPIADFTFLPDVFFAIPASYRPEGWGMPRPSGLPRIFSVLLGGFDIQLEHNLVTDHETAVFERSFKIHTEVATVNLGASLEASDGDARSHTRAAT